MELESVKRISLDINNNKNVTVQSVQYDNDFKTLIINITEDGKPYIIDSTNIKIILKCTKPDGTYVIRDCNILEDGSLSVVIDGQILTVYGIVKSEIALMEIETDVIAHTMPFKIFVSQSVCDDEQVTSSSEFNAFEKTMIGYVDQAKKAAEDAAKEVSTDIVEEFKAAVKEDMEISKQCALDSEQYANQSLEYKNEAGEYVETVQSAVTVVAEFSNTASNAANNASLSENNSQKYMNSAKSYSDNAEAYCLDANNSAENAGISEQNALQSANSASDSLSQIIAIESSINEKAENINVHVTEAKGYSDAASVAASSAQSSKEYVETEVANLNNVVETVSQYEESAKLSSNNAKSSEDKALISEQNAKVSENIVKASEENVVNLEANTLAYKEIAENASTIATEKAEEIVQYNGIAKSYAIGTDGEIREGDASDNAKYYYEQTRDISQSLSGVLKPIGTITFEELPDNTSSGDMYNISNEFVTDERFREGNGRTMPIGTNVYYTEDGKWDCLAGSPVTGIKGSNETSYRQGNVEITPDNLGLHSVATSGSYTDLSDTPTIATLGGDDATHRLVTDEEKEGWNSATKVEKSSTNGNIKINGTETTVYTHPSGTNPHGTTKNDVGLGNVGNYKAVSTVASQGLSDTEKSNARANIGAGTSSFSGSYNDLTDKPTIPTIGNGTITITQNGATKGTFTMNQSGDTTIELTDNNTTYGVATQSANGLMSVADKTKLDGIAISAEVNQNAFSNVVVGSTTISADSKTDSLTLAGSNVTITPDADNDKITIGITKANVTSALGYTPPTTDTTYGVATSSALGLVKSGTDITVDSSGNVSVNDDSHNHVISNVDGLQSALDGKAASSHTHSYIESKENYTFDSSTLPTSFDYGISTGFVDSNSGFGSFGSVLIVRSYDGGGGSLQLYAPYSPNYGGTHMKARFGNYESNSGNSWTDLKEIAWISDIPTKYAGSSSAGGSATSAVKLDTATAGSATQPVYFSSGKPVACTYTLGASVPSGAVFTDTDTKNTAGSTNTSSKIYLIGATSQATNPKTYSHDTVYVGTDGHLYSDSKQVVNLSGSQALTNKTYNGYTLGAACAYGVATSITSGDTSNLPTNHAVATAISNTVGRSYIANNLTTTSGGYVLDARQGKALGDRVSNLETWTLTTVTNGKWYYRKVGTVTIDGTAKDVYECHYNGSELITFNGTYGSFYFNTTSIKINLPKTFTGWMSIQAQAFSSAGIFTVALNNITSTQLSFWVGSAKQDNGSVNISFDCLLY